MGAATEPERQGDITADISAACQGTVQQQTRWLSMLVREIATSMQHTYVERWQHRVFVMQQAWEPFPCWEQSGGRRHSLCTPGGLQVPILCLRHGDSIHSAYESTVVNELLEVRQQLPTSV